jgi:malonate transporter and related proteins
MLLVASVILPVFGIIVFGYGLVALRILPVRLARWISTFVYWVAIPAILFRSMSVNAPHLSGKLDLLAAYYLGALLLFGVGIALARYGWGYDLARQGLVGFNLCFGNTVQIGVPLALSALGPEGLADHTLIVASHAILLLTLATLVVEWGRSAADGQTRAIVHRIAAALRAIALNPVILSIAAGLAWGAIGPPLPRIVSFPIDVLAYFAGPAALFVAGAALTQFRIGGFLRESLMLAVLKIVALPAIVWLFATQIFVLSPMEFAVATIAAGLPTGNNVFILAQRYRTYEDVSASATIVSTAISALTLSVLVALLAPAVR